MDLVDFLGVVTALIVVPGLAFILWDDFQRRKLAHEKDLFTV